MSPPLGHIIFIYRDSDPTSLSSFSFKCCVLNGEATNTNFIVFDLTPSGLEFTNYHTLGEHANHYTTDAVHFLSIKLQVYHIMSRSCSYKN